MFKVTKVRKIEWPVLVSAPQPGGKVKQYEVMVEFEDIPQDEHDAFYANDGGLDAALMKRVIVGWKAGQFKDEQDQDILFSPEALDELLKIQFLKVALVAAYLQLHNGRAAVRKN